MDSVFASCPFKDVTPALTVTEIECFLLEIVFPLIFSLIRSASAAASSITNSLGMKLVLVRKGEFEMGSEELGSEKPRHQVRITKDVYLAAHPVIDRLGCVAAVRPERRVGSRL